MKSTYSLAFMKIKNNLLAKLILGTGLVSALSFLSGCATTTNTGDQMKPMKGGEHQMMLNKLDTKEDADALKTDDSIAMVCAKCKTVWVTRVKQGVKGAQLLMQNGLPTELLGTHACAGCNSTITVTGHAKGNITELKHSCGMCGDSSAFCCATKPGSGATTGMEKEK